MIKPHQYQQYANQAKRLKGHSMEAWCCLMWSGAHHLTGTFYSERFKK